MMSTQQEAIEFPKGDIRLAFCPSCGFIANVAFDPNIQDYSPIYEDQQCFSPTFNAFAYNLANRLIERYDLHDKDIVEIGCGKGDFLILLCELGGNRGVGIDPTCMRERIHSKAAERVIFIQDYYSEKYAKYHGDFVCCRHTLEHIQLTAEFVSSVRRAIGDRTDTIVFFEVPDVIRVLRELAFWDIYYEHCSYFSLGSLARLFRLSGFDVIDLSKDFDDQYLLIEARPANNVSMSHLDKEDDLQELLGAVKYFAEHHKTKLAMWKHYFQEIMQNGKRIVVWGSGSKCVAFLTTLHIKNEVEFIVDINPYRHGKYIAGAGKRIMPPEFLKEYRPDVVVVMNSIYSSEIQQMLEDMGLMPDVVTV